MKTDLKNFILFLLTLLFHNASISQEKNIEWNTSNGWKAFDQIESKSVIINRSKPYLGSVTIHHLSNNTKSLIFKQDSLLIDKGINRLNFTYKLIPTSKDSIEKRTKIQVVWKPLHSKNNYSKEFSIPLRKVKLPELSYSDTTLNFLYSGEKSLSTLIIFNLSDQDTTLIVDSTSFRFKSDTSIHISELVQSNRLKMQKIYVNVFNKKETLTFDSLLYDLGQLSPLQAKQEVENKSDENFKIAPIKINGDISIENNSFFDTPQHSNNYQYPNTIFRANNSVTLYGIPLELSAYHNTNDNLNPNFRNFFSLRLDVRQYREQMKSKIKDEYYKKSYSVPEINTDLERNNTSIKKLEQSKKILKEYPNEKLNFEDFFEQDISQLRDSEKKDSLFQLPSDTLKKPSIQLPDSLISEQADTSNQRVINKIDYYLSRLKSSNNRKRMLKDSLSSEAVTNNPDLPLENRSLYNSFDKNSLTSLLLRFEKLEVGYFYEYAGEYSIKDIEMKGINSRVLIDKDYEISFLHGKINSFQSFNLQELDDDRKITSFSFSSRSLDFLNTEIRITNYNSTKNINPEKANNINDYSVTSTKLSGTVIDKIYYELDLNILNNTFNQEWSNVDIKKNSATYAKVGFTPISKIDIHSEFRQVGSGYRSDGVYFLVRNVQAYSFGYQVRLFKNKVYVKNDFSIQKRNFEQKELRNESKKFFFEVGTRLKRYPNIQLTHSPITVQIANKLDTSFSDLNAFTTVSIARLYYFKRIKKTTYNTALIYSEISNESFSQKNTQKGFQHFISFNNEKISFSFTSAYLNIFEKARFISTHLQYKLNNKLSTTFYLAKNLIKDRYSEIYRLKVESWILKNLQLGMGGILLNEKSNDLNFGSTLSLRFTY